MAWFLRIFSCIFFKMFFFFTLLLAAAPIYGDRNELQPNEKTSRPTFLMVLWPERGGLIRSVTGDISVEDDLRNAWHDGHLPTYTGMAIQFYAPQSDSLKSYLQAVEKASPECIEGDGWFIEREINGYQNGFAANRKYYPLLSVHPGEEEKFSPEILFRSPLAHWQGLLGVVHPSYDIGGGLQLEYWKQKTGKDADWVALYSTEETLRQLFIGSIKAAAVSGKSLDDFLQKSGREDLAGRIDRTILDREGSPPAIYLRRDLFDNPFFRTVIAETWLRGHFPKWFHSLAAAWPNHLAEMDRGAAN
ncbi:MAG: hypothetical protein AB1656_20595 [Candidatus Omnitrophota bacterium]